MFCGYVDMPIFKQEHARFPMVPAQRPLHSAEFDTKHIILWFGKKGMMSIPLRWLTIPDILRVRCRGDASSHFFLGGRGIRFVTLHAAGSFRTCCRVHMPWILLRHLLHPPSQGEPTQEVQWFRSVSGAQV